MTQDDAKAFIVALNGIGGYVPPILFQQVIGNNVCRILEAIANGQVSFQVGAPPAPAAPKAGNGLDIDQAIEQPEAGG